MLPTVDPVHRNKVTRQGSNVTLVCLGRNVHALDTIAVWKFKGQEIQKSANKKAFEKWLPGKRGNFSLHITNVSEKDVGQYTCSVFVANFGKSDFAEGVIRLKLYDSGTFVILPNSLHNPMKKGCSCTPTWPAFISGFCIAKKRGMFSAVNRIPYPRRYLIIH